MSWENEMFDGPSDVYSMDNNALYGKVAYSLSYREAVQKGIVTDMQIHLVHVTDEDVIDALESGDDIILNGDNGEDVVLDTDGKIDIIEQAYFESDYTHYEEKQLAEMVEKIQEKELPIEIARKAEGFSNGHSVSESKKEGFEEILLYIWPLG